MAKRNTRRTVYYAVCCDCEECLEEIGGEMMFMCSGIKSKKEALDILKHPQHRSKFFHDSPSLFVARVTEILSPIPQRKPKRKAA